MWIRFREKLLNTEECRLIEVEGGAIYFLSGDRRERLHFESPENAQKAFVKIADRLGRDWRYLDLEGYADPVKSHRDPADAGTQA